MSKEAPQRRRVLRWVRNSAVALAACYVALLVFVQASERVMRYRSERLLAEMRDLQVGKSTWADLQGIRTRWGAWGNYEGTCAQSHCDYTVSLTDVPGPWRIAGPVSYLGHSHLASASLNVSVDAGIVKQTSFHFWVEVPKGYGPRWEREEPQDPGYVPYSTGQYALIARTTSRLEMSHLCCYWPNPVPHPNYVLKKPGGCEGCLAIWTEFLPQASSSEKMRLTKFNFSCITRWKPCADEEDIMPEAGAEFARQMQARTEENTRQEQCAYSANELSNAALNTALAEVEEVSTGGSNSQSYLKLRLINRLGGPAVWNPDETVRVDASMEGRQGKLISEAFKERKPLIVLYPQGPQANTLLPYTCGLLAYSEQTQKDVIAGVSLGKGIPEYE